MSDSVAGILAFLSDHFGEDFHSYAPSLAAKIVDERVARLALQDPPAYWGYLAVNPAEPALLARLLRVRFTSFFRDALQFELLRCLVIPAMLSEYHKGFFRVWSAACASGEEAYSLAMVIDEALKVSAVRPRVQIFATDIAEDALEEAGHGCYRTESLGGCTLGRLAAYFTKTDRGYRVKEELREQVTFSRYDLLCERTYVPPESLFGGFDLVLCRNFLMYLTPEAYGRVFDKLFRALNPGGVLLLGKAETVPERYAPVFERIVDCGNLYRKKSFFGE